MSLHSRTNSQLVFGGIGGKREGYEFFTLALRYPVAAHAWLAS
jgi:hypothetical protein